MKKTYTAPSMYIECFAIDDSLTLSDGGIGAGDYENFEDLFG